MDLMGNIANLKLFFLLGTSIWWDHMLLFQFLRLFSIKASRRILPLASLCVPEIVIIS